MDDRGVTINRDITTSPRKGTETCLCVAFQSQQKITTYPRKGTETIIMKIIIIKPIKLQLIPVRGRKLQFTLTHACEPYYNLSPQGDGNLLRVSSADTLYSNYNLSP